MQDKDIGSYSVQISDANSDVIESEPVMLTTDVGLPFGSAAGIVVLCAACGLGAIAVIRWRRKESGN